MTKSKEEKFKIILEYIKDLSIETPSATTLLFVREIFQNIIWILIFHHWHLKINFWK